MNCRRSVNGNVDGPLNVCFVSPQVILVQVNPGEAFTIRREDGQFQCITGKKVLHMHHASVYKT